MEKRNPNIIVEESDLITNFLQIINGLLLFGWNIWKISISKFPILDGRTLIVYYKSTGNPMDKKNVLNRIIDAQVVAVIRGPSEELSIKMVEALIKGGITAIEITYSTPNAAKVVKALDTKYGDKITLGMGTLIEPAQAIEAKEAGARFLVSPVCDPVLGKAMIDTGLVVMIGALTPTEVLQAFKLGSDVVKIFPGSLLGPAYVKAIKGPFPQIPIMPTGGVSAANVADWFAAGVVAVGAGSELCPPQLAREGKFDEITTRGREFIEAARKGKPRLNK